ncbi:MAG: protein kinase [Sandaracinus sp.]|nr:protein kinase [Sandaracinus sp.]
MRARSATVREHEIPAGPAPLVPGALVGGRYRVQARVGTGAFGDVYRAEDVEVPGHVVALKLLHQPSYSADTKESALRELRHLASVFHPSVVSLKDHGWFDGRLWFVMPWYEGETLESRLQRGPLTRAEARRIFEPLARALAAVHEAGLRHQDVKPDNVFLAQVPGFGDESVLPVLIDLGVAATDAEMLVAGTPTYFAPEVAAQFASGVTDKPRVTNRADVFSLALALRNALDPDTQDDVPGGAIETFIEGRAVSVPPLPMRRDLRFLRPVLARWMSLDPEDRPSASELASELAVLTLPEDRRRKRRALWRWLLPTLVVLGSLASAGVLHFRARAAEESARAAARVAAVREDLAATEEARRQLAADAADIRANLEDERLGRAELESRLADTSAALHQRRAELGRARERVASLEQARQDVEHARAALETTLGTRNAELAAIRGQLTALGAELERERGTRQRLREELAQVQDARDTLEAQMASERARRAAADARAAELETELASAIRARQVAERALRESRAAEAGPATPEPEVAPAPF